MRIRSCSTTINRETSARTSGSIGLVQDSIGRDVRPSRRRRVRPLSPGERLLEDRSASEGCSSRTHSSDRSKTVSMAGGHQRARPLASGTVGIRRRSQRRPRQQPRHESSERRQGALSRIAHTCTWSVASTPCSRRTPGSWRCATPCWVNPYVAGDAAGTPKPAFSARAVGDRSLRRAGSDTDSEGLYRHRTWRPSPAIG